MRVNFILTVGVVCLYSLKKVTDGNGYRGNRFGKVTKVVNVCGLKRVTTVL